mmetsp:Transcript_1240/g.2991  ORF Transcript_1240/g.2991 Transcript_1240/m.2991 type:complete len:290 (-) Transcript_1240:1247-2116(-)
MTTESVRNFSRIAVFGLRGILFLIMMTIIRMPSARLCGSLPRGGLAFRPRRSDLTLPLVVFEKEIRIALEFRLESLPPPFENVGGDRHGLISPGTPRVERQHEIVEVLGDLLRHQRTSVGRRSRRFRCVDAEKIAAVACVGEVPHDIYRFDRYPEVDPHVRRRLPTIEPDEFLAFRPTRPKDPRLRFGRNQGPEKLESGLLLLDRCRSSVPARNLHLPIDQEARIRGNGGCGTGKQEKHQLVDGSQRRGEISPGCGNRQGELRAVRTLYGAEVRADHGRGSDQAEHRRA